MSLQAIRVEKLHSYLLAVPLGGELPSAKAIADQLHFPIAAGAYHVCEAFDVLAVQRRIVQRHGTRSEARGHRIVRLANGRVLRTRNCPLELPPT